MKIPVAAALILAAVLCSSGYLLSQDAKDLQEPAPALFSDNYMVEGIMYSEKNPFAMINGEIYKCNDMIGEARIIKITKREIIVEYKGKAREYETGGVIILDGFLSDTDSKSEEMAAEIESDRKKKAMEIAKERRRAIELTGDSVQYLEYDGEKVQIDIYNPGLKACPVVVLVHGAAGISGDRAARYKNFAMSLKKKGIIAINVHYFDCKWDRAKAVMKAVDFVQDIPNADKGNIGMVGYSNGGTIALMVASKDDRIKTLAISAGYMPKDFGKKDAARLPKTYFISGSEDPAMQTLAALEKWFKELGKEFESRVNKGFGHTSTQEVFDADWDTIVSYFVGNLNRRIR